MTALKDAFANVHTKDIKNRQGEVVRTVDYVGWSQVADRLDEAAPGWSFEVVTLSDDWCLGKLTIGDRIYMNVGYAENADADWKKEPLKDAVSDALKRCAALAGVARYLYDKDTPRPQTAKPVQGPVKPAAPVATPPATEAPWPAETLVPLAQKIFPDAVIRPDEADGKCPDHGFEWKHNSRGFYCSGKTNGEWCKRRPSIAWAAAANEEWSRTAS